MLKVVFCQRLVYSVFGIMSLSAVLRKQGHQVELVMEADIDKVVQEVLTLAPDMVMFSTLTATGDFEWAVSIARKLKSTDPKILTVFGNSYPTLYPEQVMAEPSIDIICLGEGEIAIGELSKCLIEARDYSTISNLWVRTPHGIIKNPMGPLLEDLDTLPFPDRELYQKYGYFDHLDSMDVLAGRGCVYDCHYCLNGTYKTLFKDKGRYIRKHSVPYMIAQLKEIKERFHPKSFTFVDELFTINKVWLAEFCNAYAQEINIPFICNVTVKTADEETVSLLAKAGAWRVCLGLETGSEKIRKEWLNKRFTNAEFLACARILHKHGVKFLTNNMLGLPGETVENAFETVRLNQQGKTDFLFFTVFQPYPGMVITAKMQNQGLISSVDPSSFQTTYFRGSMLHNKDIRQIVNLHKFFLLAVKFPILNPLIRWLIKMPPNWFFEQVFVLSYGWMQWKCFRRNFLQLMFMGLKNLKVFYGK